ncbi:tigger transposable element-derived protein 4-like [Neoarius graeffei]|uniref:tigger transposable element-derived protein 4-like n=1 Tax=Neoarius graeffei TaxID=443677 RepID=UPI00298D3811|nr:tigger transposable element-derived protein 4-like [Neoarius graeffei]
MASNKCKQWTYKEKYDIVKFAESHPEWKKVELAAKFDIKKQTLSDILRKTVEIVSIIENPDKVAKDAGGIKRVRKVSYEDVDVALLVWFRQKAALPNIRIDTEMLRLKAEYFAHQLGHEDTTISGGWVDRFKRRWGIRKVLKCGEAGSVDKDVVTDWQTRKLADILKRYKAEDIYNADKTGLFYMMLPENALGFTGETVHGGKQKKTRITLLVTANMGGSDKLPMFVIGKSQKPRAFKGCRQIPLEYTANKKAWMTSHLFEEWLKKLDSRMVRGNRKICMIVDNCLAHPDVDLQNIELVFLPPNTTSVTQPMDSGIIKNLKFYYRRILATRRLEAAEKDEQFKWDLLDALFAIKTSWANVETSTIINVYRKVGFISTYEDEQPREVEMVEPTDATDTDQQDRREFRNVWDRLREFLGERMPENMDDYLDIDADENEVYEVMTDQEIVESVQSLASADSDVEIAGDEGDGPADEGATEPPPPPSVKVTSDAVDVIRRFALTMPESSDTDDVFKLAQKMEILLTNEAPKRLKQSSILDFVQS